VISPHNLRYGLELQLQIKLFDIFDWAEGEYVFRADVAAPAEAVGLEMSAAQIVLEGVRRHYHHDRLDAALRPHLGEYPELAAAPERRFLDLDLTPGEERFVHAMDGATRLGDLLDAPPPGLDAHGARALTVALDALGMITLRARAVRARTVPPLPSVLEELSPADTTPNARPDLGEAALSDAELAALLADRRGADPFHVLALRPDATQADVDRAYGQLARELHPDRFRGRPPSTLRMASEAFALATGAHTALSDPAKRVELAKKARPAPPPLAPVEALIEEATDPVSPSPDPAARSLAADRLFREGEARLRARDYAQAEWLFRQAAELRADAAAYLAYQAWSGFLAGKQSRRAAEMAAPLLRHAAELGPTLEQPHLFLGLVYAALGEDDLAEPELEKAVQVNPDSSEALRELKRIHARRG
jgi:tetratricopeptide (TPR) repeat protein